MLKRKNPKNKKRQAMMCFFALLVVLIVLFGCTKTFLDQESLVKAEEDYNLVAEEMLEIDENIQKGIMASNQMGIEMLLSMAQKNQEKNLLFSPTSLAFALAMVQNGAEGETKAEILQFLEEEDIGINERYNILMNYFNSLAAEEKVDIPGIKMKIANSLWLREKLVPKQDFVNILQFFYNAEVYLEDFNDEKTVDHMNRWVKNQTNHLLQKTIAEIAPETSAYLMNTVYFKGAWINEFSKAATKKEKFIKSGGETILVDMMHQIETLPYYEDELCQMTSLPYHGGCSLLLVLPKGDLADFLRLVKIDDFQWLLGMERRFQKRLELSLPKFDYEVNNDLKELLIAKGMMRSFSPTNAEFGSMIELENDNVYISSVFQNSRITLDEEGTEAAAVTVIEMGVTSIMPEEPIAFKCDKPFLYIIKEDKTGAALFMGIVKQP